MAVYNATLKRWGEVFHFASIDNENWLPLNQPLVPGYEQEFQKLLDGDGKTYKPLVFTKRFLEQQPPDAEIVFH